MPELNLKDLRRDFRDMRRDFRMPVLRLPEMSRDDIAKALGEARKDLREVRRELEEFRRDFEMPRVDITAVEMPKVDVDKVVDATKDATKQVDLTKVADGAKQAAVAVGLVKAPSRGLRRAPFVAAGLATLAVVGFALLNSPTMKARMRDASQKARERMAQRRSAWDLDDEPRAFDAAEPAGVAASSYSDAIPSTDSPFSQPPSGLPEGLGTDGTTHRIEEDAPARA
jgi:hypothetical protein